MPTSRPFAFNTGATIAGTTQIGSLAVGTPTSGTTGLPTWWNGPDEDLGYVIAKSVSGNTQPTPRIGVFASVGFYRSTGLTESSYINLAQKISTNQTFANGNAAYLWLSGNGYWSSWVYTSTGVTFSQAFTGGSAPSTATEIAWNVFRTGLTGNYTQFVWSSTNGSSITVSHPTLVQVLANGLRLGISTGVTISSVVWRVGTGCGTPKIGGTAIEFSNVASCSASSTYALRPQINNPNWGGTNQSTVGAPSQTITLTFS
jgi:hypothetical protein